MLTAPLLPVPPLAVLLQQVMAMTQQQIDALPEATRAQVLQVKQLLGAQGALK